MTGNPAPVRPPQPSGGAGEWWGGFAAMLVALPSAIAYGIAVFGPLGADFVARGVQAGMVGAAILGLVAPLLGGAPRLISAPCAPAAAVLAALALELQRTSAASGASLAPERIAGLLVLVAAIAGLLQLAYGAIGAGRLIKYIPFPVVSGYMGGVGVLIFSSQVPKFFGLHGAIRSAETWSHWQPAAVVIGAVTIAGVLLAPRLTKAVPAAIIGLGAGVAAYLAWAAFVPALRQLEGNSLVIGGIGGGVGGLASTLATQWSDWTGLQLKDLAHVVLPALTLSVLLSVDTLKTCVVLDALTRSRHQSNRELIGQGTGNLFSALAGGMPGAGTMGATLVNHASGGRTRLSGVSEGAFVLLAFLVLGRSIAWVPVSALAGLLMVVAVRMIDWRNFELLRQKSTLLDFAVIAAVVIVAVTANLIAAAGAGLGLSILLFIREQIQGSVIRRKITGDKFSSKQHRLPAEQAVLERCGVETTICELQGSLFFGTTDQLLTELEPDLKRCRHLILDLRRVRSVDFTAAHMLEQFEAMLRERDGYLIFSRLPALLSEGRDLRRYFEQVGVLRERVLVFETLDDALRWAEDRILARELPASGGSEAPLGLAEFELFREVAAGEARTVLESCVTERSCQADETIFSGGATGDELFLIRRGVVRIVLPLAHGGYHNLAAFGRGNFFGEMTFLDGGKRSANAVATTPVELFVLSRARFDAVVRSHPEVGVRILGELARALALRMRHTDAEIRALYDA
jgi:SulP family sulfate permease